MHRLLRDRNVVELLLSMSLEIIQLLGLKHLKTFMHPLNLILNLFLRAFLSIESIVDLISCPQLTLLQPTQFVLSMIDPITNLLELLDIRSMLHLLDSDLQLQDFTNYVA